MPLLVISCKKESPCASQKRSRFGVRTIRSRGNSRSTANVMRMDCAICVVGVHHHEHVNIAPFMRRAVGERAEQDNLLGIELLRDPPRESANRRERDVGRYITIVLLANNLML